MRQRIPGYGSRASEHEDDGMHRTSSQHDSASHTALRAALCALAMAMLLASGCGDDGEDDDATNDDGSSGRSDSGSEKPDSGGETAGGMCADGCECNKDEICDY